MMLGEGIRFRGRENLSSCVGSATWEQDDFDQGIVFVRYFISKLKL